MPININSQEYVEAERDFYEADSPEEQLTALKKMISHSPGHKGAENLRQQLTTRRKKLEAQIEKQKRTKKGGRREGIKKEDMQGVLIGKTNSGKSTLMKLLTNAEPKISPFPFTTIQPVVGILGIKGTNIQIIENPAIDSDFYDKGIPNTADTLILLVNKFEEIAEIKKKIKNSSAKQIICFNLKENLDSQEKRKLTARLQSKKHNFITINAKTKEGLEELKEKIFSSFDKIRVYTKEPGKDASEKPMILEPNSTVEEAAEKILKGYSKKVSETKIWGPSSKFGGQKVGLKHTLKDKDIIEFKTN
jgi:ribosome-interacting GTPase 1